MNKSSYRLLSIFAAFALVLGNSYKASTSSIYVASADANDEVHWTITGSNSITLDWRGPSNTVSYGITTAYGVMVTATSPSPMPFSSAGPFWESKLVNLQTNTTYHYSIGGEADHTFKTALPKGNSGFTVDVIGDVGDTNSFTDVGPIQAMIAADQPSLALIVGDLTYGNSNGQAVVDQHFNDVQAWSLGSTAYMPAWGNHEWDTSSDNLKNYKGRFDFPNPQTSPGSPAISCCGEDWYYFDYGNTRFIAYPEPFSGAWSDWNTHAKVLMDEAQADPAITFIVTFGHRPAYSSGYHSGDTTLQGYLDALGASHSKYVLNLNGHSHNYERTFPQSNVVHVTAGTGGSGLEEIGTCLWGICTQPSWSAKRYMHLGVLRLAFNANSIQGAFICGPSGGGTNDINCTQGDVIDNFTIPTGTKHFTANEEGAYTDAEAVGFNIHDTGMSAGTINALPVGSQAMVWVGIGASNCSTTLSSTFTSFVLANATNPKLYGFYLTDEPLDATCVAAVTAYTNYIHANAPSKKAFILLTDWPGTYAAYRPAVTNVDLIGLDPYPVKDGTYDNTLISNQINNAIAAGIPLANIVPVFQTFGGAGWDAPTASQLTTILDQWAALVPNPPLDYAYSWGTQSNYLSDALVNRADWRDIMAAHNQALNIIAGNAGVGRASLGYVDGVAKTVTSKADGSYILPVSNNWSGTVIPSKFCYGFTPASHVYKNITVNQTSQDFTANFLTYTLTGNVGVGGATMQYMDGTPKTVIADGSGNYTITVPCGWSGVVTPYKTGYIFTPVNKSYSHVQSNQTGQNYTASVCAGCADVQVTLGGNPQGNYTLGTGMQVYPRYGLNGGPVHVVSTNSQSILTSERAVFGNSFNSIVGYPGNQLTTDYWFTSLDDAGMITYLIIGNPDAVNTALVDVYIGGVKMNASPYVIGPGQRVYPRFGINGGPVHVVSNIPVFTSERSKYQSSFNEVLGYPGNRLTTDYWFTSLDDLGMITYLIIGNPDAVNTATVDVYIGGVKMNASPYVIGPGQRVYPRYGINGGPVHVVSDIPVFTSERSKYQSSFNEVLGYPGNRLASDYWFTSLDDVGMITYLIIGNPDAVNTATVDVYIGGVKMNTTPYVIGPGQRVYPRFGISGGPVHVVSDIPVFTSERSKYQSSFNEILGLPSGQLTTDYWFTSLDDAGMLTYLVITKP